MTVSGHLVQLASADFSGETSFCGACQGLKVLEPTVFSVEMGLRELFSRAKDKIMPDVTSLLRDLSSRKPAGHHTCHQEHVGSARVLSRKKTV